MRPRDAAIRALRIAHALLVQLASSSGLTSLEHETRFRNSIPDINSTAPPEFKKPDHTSGRSDDNPRRQDAQKDSLSWRPWRRCVRFRLGVKYSAPAPRVKVEHRRRILLRPALGHPLGFDGPSINPDSREHSRRPLQRLTPWKSNPTS